MLDLTLSGNPRYQPKSFVPYFGYDNLALALVEVEVAALRTLADMQVISPDDIVLLTHEVETKLYAITTSEMDRVERTDTSEYGPKTNHDIRALVRIMQTILPEPLRRWVHVPLTSYDVIDTARSIQFVRAHQDVVRPKTDRLIGCLRERALSHASDVQIGRTHGQHALPITVGFWFATILNRVLFNIQEANRYSGGLVGKISGAVGAYNAQAALGITGGSDRSFEQRVLDRLGLRAAPISTQILPPEPLAYYLFSCLMLSASLGQFGRDGRHLMRTEIAELAEPFEKGQVGSSTMAHKRNPLHFENLEGTWLKNRNEFGKVLDTMISEHQRDLVGSSLARDFPTLIVNLVYQLETLLRPDGDGTAFVSRIVVDTKSCRRNLNMQGDQILAEPWYIMLQMYGYPGDAHHIINHRAMPMIGNGASSLYEAVHLLAEDDLYIRRALLSIPPEALTMFQNPATYVGRAAGKVVEICDRATEYLDNR